VCHAFLTDTSFYQLLTRIDESIAEEVRARGCRCGGVLHSARYPRKPRGLRSALDASYERRLSFCCAQNGCRRRHTPASVRFLGRKVYLSVIVVLITALQHGLTERRRRRLIEELDVPAQTLWRWRRWWREQFVQSRCWRALARWEKLSASCRVKVPVGKEESRGSPGRASHPPVSSLGSMAERRKSRTRWTKRRQRIL
jgi:hypothetical protein